jgi:dGTPase
MNVQPVNVLAAYAAHDARSRGRRHVEPPAEYRGEFQRDRDRIIHCNAFRRLAYKTQVFVNHEGDLYRTRVTHSIEVAQIARSIARALQLNEPLVEAISLAHDLGHTPFGHAGQDALNECMREYGGFEHNLQSLRVVDELEERYADFPGLNLSFECREGILKHCALPKARELGDVGQRFIDRTQAGLEAQLANLADEIAYNNHDVDDGLRAGLITLDDLCSVQLVRRHADAVRAAYPALPARRSIHEIVRRMINEVVVDVIRTSDELLQAAAPADIDAVRVHGSALIAMSAPVREQHLELKRFLRERVYRHHRVLRMTSKARRVLEALFTAFIGDVRLLPEEYCEAANRAEAADGIDPGASPLVRPRGAHLMSKDIANRDRLIFALDVADADIARKLVEQLGEAVTFYKMGLELFMAGEYFPLLEWLVARNKKVFVDLKFFDVPATVAAAVRQLRNRGVTFATVHGNQSIMQAAAEAKGDVKILGVTVLTSLDRGDLDDLGFTCDVQQLVLSRARRALEAGCDGVVSSGLEAQLLRQYIDDRLLVITPGIRPVDNRPSDDQKRVVSVEQALQYGADYIVVGRPIRDAADPRAAAERVQEQIAATLA